MDIRNSKVVCILLLDMLDADLSKVIDYELDDNSETIIMFIYLKYIHKKELTDYQKSVSS